MAKTPTPSAHNPLMKHVAVPLTPRERQEKSDELVRTLNDLKRLQEHYALLKEQHKATGKNRQLTIRELSHDLKDNYVMRPVACEQRLDIESNTMTTTRLNSGEMIDTRPLTEEERDAALGSPVRAGGR